MKGLWQWGVQKANKAVAVLEEAVAPTLPPQQVFEKHWESIVDFYAHTHATEDVDPFGERLETIFILLNASYLDSTRSIDFLSRQERTRQFKHHVAPR